MIVRHRRTSRYWNRKGIGLRAVVIEMVAAVCPSIRAALLTPTEALATT